MTSGHTVLVSGGSGRLAAALLRAGEASKHRILCVDEETFDVTDRSQIEATIDKCAPSVLIHCAAVLSENDGSALIEANIIGTANLVMACSRRNLKLVYISTDYVYPKHAEFHSEDDPLLPFTSYGWSKMGGECAVQTYENSLIVRGAFCPSPYPHQKAYTDVKKNMIYQDKAANYILQLLGERGVVNIGEPQPASLYNFALATRPDVTPIKSPSEYEPKRSQLSVERLQKTLTKNK